MPDPAPRINLIARTNGVGLDRDMNLVDSALTALGFEVTQSHCRAVPPWHRWIPRSPRFDANIFMERVFLRWLPHSQKNFLIPNQERFPERHLSYLKRLDGVFCKSRHALEIFSDHHDSVHYSGFTSVDLFTQDAPRNTPGILHLAGRSTLKSTSTVLTLWEQHPEWPELTIVQCAENAPTSSPPNVKVITDYVSNDELLTMMNSHRIHLCPSLSEGWGHYIAEALGCKATVITTDAPPMNELVDSSRGILVAYSSTEPRHLGTNFQVNPAALEAAIERAIAMPPEEAESMGQHARDWFLKNDATFRRALPELLGRLVR